MPARGEEKHPREGDLRRPRLEVEQHSCVAACDLHAVSFADRNVFEPVACLVHEFAWVVDGVEDAVGTDFQHYIGQRLCSKVATGRDVKVLSEILRHGSLRFRRELALYYAIIDTPFAEGQPLT